MTGISKEQVILAMKSGKALIVSNAVNPWIRLKERGKMGSIRVDQQTFSDLLGGGEIVAANTAKVGHGYVDTYYKLAS